MLGLDLPEVGLCVLLLGRVLPSLVLFCSFVSTLLPVPGPASLTLPSLDGSCLVSFFLLTAACLRGRLLVALAVAPALLALGLRLTDAVRHLVVRVLLDDVEVA